MTKPEITPAHITAMHGVRTGANIFGWGIAQLLRDVERYDHELITILTPRELCEDVGATEQDIYDKAGNLCYFGAILTEKGKEFLQRRTAAMVRASFGNPPDGRETIQSAMQDDIDDPALKPPTA